MSTGLLYLQSANFGVDKIPEGPILCNSIKGFSVVLFYSPTRCQYSPAAIAELKKVVGTVNGVVFAALNIDKNMDVVRMSRNTITSIEGVPYIMLYLNGVPKQIYPENYPFTAEAIRNFSATVSLNMTRAQTNASASQPKKPLAESNTPDRKSTIYYIGSPLKRKNCTYISIEDQTKAATSKQPQKAGVGNAQYR